MTNPADDASGPSLVQARKPTHHNHHNHNHQYLHRRLHSHAGSDSSGPHIRSPPAEKLDEREVVIVQSVSVVHYIDSAGVVTGVSTVPFDPATPSPVVSAGVTASGDVLPSVSLSRPIPSLIDGASSTTASTSHSLSASAKTLTSTPLSSTSAFPVLSTGIFNSSSHFPSLFSNRTKGLFVNSTRTTLSSRPSFSSFSTTSSSSSTRSTSTISDVLTIVAGGAGAGAGSNANAGPAPAVPPSPPAQPAPDSGSGLPPETRNAVVGGVVGSVAGIALVALVFLYFLKWRKQRSGGIILLGDGDSTAWGRGLGSGPSGGGGGGAMAERSGPFAIPSALATLTGGKRAIEAAPAEPPTQEKGFYRVSGRKLISVLESGGDGYSDPHDSIGSAASYYRDSQGFMDGPNQSPLQLGSPMRPVSGVPIFRDGPQRTPVHEEGPVPPDLRLSSFPGLALPDPGLGRSLVLARDGSRGSGSRFTEDT